MEEPRESDTEVGMLPYEVTPKTSTSPAETLLKEADTVVVEQEYEQPPEACCTMLNAVGVTVLVVVVVEVTVDGCTIGA
jgi:hypothetical protein